MININSKTIATARRCCLLAILFLSGGIAQAQFSVSANKTAAQLANAMVGAGSGITILNPTLTCPTAANGTYNNTPGAILGVGNGILLTTGSAAAIDNPATYFEDTQHGSAGDPSLATLAGQTVYDACVLQFDFVPQGDSIKFRYQFGSEEYPDYNCGSYNDVFGFFISGPGYGSPTNIALIPGTNIPVAINTVNDGSNVNSNCTQFGAGSPFTMYYINNNGSSNKPAFNGYTTIFNARAKVIPCDTFHLKLGVADGTDYRYTSGVFVEAGSLTILPPVISGCPSTINVNTGAGATACSATATWTPPTVNNSCLNVTSSNSHSPGATFPVGTTQVTYSFTNTGGTSTCVFNVIVKDNTPPVPACKPYTLTLVNGAGTVTPANVNNGSTDNCGITSMSVSPNNFTCADTGNRTVTLTVTDAAGNSSTCTSVVTIIYPDCNVTVTPSNSVYTGGIATNLYLGYGPQSATLNASGTGTYSWTPATNLSASNVQSPVFTPINPGTYHYDVTVTYPNGCKRTCGVTLCVKEARVNGYQGRAVWVCHRTSPSALGLNQIVLLAAVPSHIGPHAYDFLGRCDQICEGYPNTDMKPSAPLGVASLYQTDFLVNTYPNPFTNDMRLKIESNSNEFVDVVIYDIAGKVLQALPKQKANAEIIIGEKLAPGVYLIDVKQGEVSQRSRVVKIK